MNEVQLLLVLSYLFLVALLLLVLIQTRLSVGLKVGLILVALAFYWFNYQGWREAQGWPAEAALPDKFLLHFAVIEEPDDESGRAGAIFLWLTDLYQDQLAEQPRAYRLPYDRELHTKVAVAVKSAKEGVLQLGIRKGSDDLPEVQKFRNAQGDFHAGLEFQPVPDPSLPEK